MGWQEDVADLRLGGGSDADVASLQQHYQQTLVEGGATQDQIDEYFGRKKPGISPEVVQRFKDNVAASPKAAESFADALEAGYQMSVFGLATRGQLPDITLPENAGWLNRLGAMAGQMAPDLVSVMPIGGYLGNLAGSSIGASLGTAAAPGLGTELGGAVGAVVGQGFGSFALPAFLRKGLMDYYAKGGENFEDYFALMVGAGHQALKEGVVGAVTAPFGNLAENAVVGPGISTAGRQFAAGVTKSAAEVGSMVTVGKAIEGKMPTAQDFADAAIGVGAFHAAGKLMNVFARTGIDPRTVAAEADKSPDLKLALHDKADNHVQIGAMLGAPDEVHGDDQAAAGKAGDAPDANVVPASGVLVDHVPPFDGQPPEPAPSAAVRPADAMSPDFSHGSRIESLGAEGGAPGAKDELASADAKPSEPDPRVAGIAADSYAQLFGKKGSQAQAAKLLDETFARDVDIAKSLSADELRKHLAVAESHMPRLALALERFGKGSRDRYDLAAADTSRRVKLFQDLLEAQGEPLKVEPEPTEKPIVVGGISNPDHELKGAPKYGPDTITVNPDAKAGATYPSAFLDAAIPPGRAPRVTFEFVPTHILDAANFRKAFEALAPGGTVVVQSANSDGPPLSSRIAATLQEAGFSDVKVNLKQAMLLGSGPHQEFEVEATKPQGEPLKAEPKPESAPPAPPETPPATEEAAAPENPKGETWTPEEAAAHVNGQIDREGNPPDARSWSQRFSDAWRSFYKGTWDKISPLLDMERDLAGKKLPEADALAYRRMRAMAGNFDKAVTILEHGPIDFATKQRIAGVKGVREILQSVEDPATLGAYAVASRSIEKAGQGIESGVNLDAAKTFVEANRAKYEAAFRDLVKFQDAVMDYLIDSGVVSKDSAAKFRAANQDYVPFHRLVEGLASGNSLKEMQGSTRKIIDPLQTIIKNVHTFIHLADMNEVKGALVARMEENGSGAGLFERIPSNTDTAELQALIDAFAEQGQDFKGLRAKDLVSFDVVRNPSTDIKYVRDGKPEIYRTTKDVASILNGTDQQQLPVLARLAAIPARLERSGILSAPAFMVRHGIRNPIMAMFYTRNGLMPWDILRGLSSYMKGSLDGKYSQDFIDAMAGGIGNRVSDVLDRNYLQKDVFALSKKTGILDRAYNLITSPAEAMHAVAAISDNAIRMAEFLKARDAGKSIPEAAFDAREVVADPSRVGSQMRILNSVVPFFHMEWQGMEKLWRAAFDNPQRFGIAAAGIAGLSAAVWALGKDDSRIDEIPEHERDLFWCVPTDDWRPVDVTNDQALLAAMSRPEDQRREIDGKLYTNEGAVFRIPKPFQAGIIFGSGTERALDAYFKEKPEAFEGFGTSVLHSVYRIPLPAFAKPMVEQFANKSTFTGNPIVPESAMKELPEYRYTDATSEPAKMIAQLIPQVPAIGRELAVSPMIIDNYIKSYTGDVGAFVLDTLTRGLHEAGIGEAAVRPSGHELIGGLEDDVPFVRSFVVRHPSATARSIQKFHDENREYQMIKATMQNRAKEGDEDAVAKLEQMQRVEYAGVDLAGAHTAMSNQAHAIRLAYENKQMTPQEKRQAIDGLYYMMASTAREANDTLRAARRAAEGAQ